MRRYAFITVDVFTDRRFGGNPLAVFPDAAGMSDAEMQSLATEFNLSETTFVLPPSDPANGAVAFPDNVTIRDAIADGEIDVGLINHYYVAQAVAEEGPDYPVGVYFPPGGLGSLMLLTSVGVLESSDRKPEAFDFVRSLLSPPSQEFFTFELEGVPARPRRRAGPLAERAARARSQSPAADLVDLNELQATIELMQESGAL